MLNNVSLLAAVAAEVSEDGSVEPNPFWLPFDINEVIWGSLAFVIIAFLLWKFARKPIGTYFAGRIHTISSELAAAASMRTEAEAERDRIKAALADSDSEAARIIAEARSSAEQLAVDIAARTETDLENIRRRGGSDLETTRTQAESDLSGELARLALGAAERVVEGSLDDAVQQRLIDDYISQVGSQN